MVGFMPFLTLQGPFMWLVILVLDVNLTAAILSATLFTLIADKKAEFEKIFNQKKEEALSRLRSYESLVVTTQ